MRYETPQDEDRARVAAMHDYNNMGAGKPISTDWHRTSNARTVDGTTYYQWLCQFCGTDIWMPWGAFEQHHCTELERLLPNAPTDP